MRHALQYLRSLFFIIQMYVFLAVWATVLFPFGLIGGRNVTLWIMRNYCHYVCWSARWIVGLKCEVRGEIPTDEVLIAAKHQSFLDIIMIFGALPRGKYIMKKELKYVPFIGWYAFLSGCVPVDRGKKGAAIKKMVRDVYASRHKGGQLIIFSQGTRVAPGVKMPYKVGSGVLYAELKQDCVPVAVNVGLFWPKSAIMRQPGTAVIEFLPRIPAGLDIRTFLERLEAEVEPASDALMAEAGFVVPTGA